MSQYPPQPYPQQGPPMGPPMGGPPMYGPPPKKKGIILLVLGLLTLIIGGVMVIIGVAAGANMVSTMEGWASSNATLIAPGEKTLQLEAGANVIMAWDSLTLDGRTYAPTDPFPSNNTQITVTNAQGSAITVESPDNAQGNIQLGNNSARMIGVFETPAAGAYTLAVSGEGMEERALTVLKQSDVMALVGGGVGIFGGVCGGVLAVLGVILLIVWVVVRK